jgi:hypothetical protein
MILKGGAGGDISGLIHASRVTGTDEVLLNAIGASAGATMRHGRLECARSAAANSTSTRNAS